VDNPRVVFLGNSESVFSNRHFAALVEPWIEIVAVVDTPRAMRGSTNPDRGSELPPFTEIAATRAVPIFEPNDPNTGDMVRQLRSLDVQCQDVVLGES